MRMRRRKRVTITLIFLVVFAIHESNVKSDYIDSPDLIHPGPEIIPVEIDRGQIIPLEDVLLWDQSQQQPWESPTQIAALVDEPSADLVQWKGDRCDEENPSDCSTQTQARHGGGHHGGGPYGGGHYGGGHYGGGPYGGGPHGGGPHGHGVGLGLGLETTVGISGWGPFISKKATFGKFGHGWKHTGPKPYSFPYHFHSLHRPTGNIYYPGNKYYSGSHANIKLKRKKKKRGGKGKKSKKKKSDKPKKYKRRKHHLKPIIVHQIEDEDDDDDDSGWERTLRQSKPNSRPFLRKELRTKLELT